MQQAAAWTLALSVLMVGLSVHLTARIWSERRLFFVDLGRALTDDDRSRAQRVLVVNGAVTALGVALSFLAPGSAAVAGFVSLVLVFVPIGYLLVETVRVARSVDRPKIAARFAVPLEDPPSLGRYLSPALNLAQGALLVGSTAAFLWLLPQLPARVPMHFDGHGVVTRLGSPREMWLFPALLAFDWALALVIAFGVSRERWALAPKDPEGYAALQLDRRTTIVRFVEVLLLAVNVGMVVSWLGLAYGSLPGKGDLVATVVVLSVVVMAIGTIAPLAYYLPKLARLQERLREIAGSDALGTREAGWRAGGLIYYAPDDPALFVPKRIGIGQTLNMARPGAWVFLGGVILVPLVISLVAMWLA
ncbi:MAG: DUF5808 domain-containing protein [Polyangiaceae bacterium]